MRRFAALCLLLVGAACGEPDPDVEVNLYVGESFARNDPELSRQRALEVAKAVLPSIIGERAAGDVDPAGPPATVHPPTTAQQFEELVDAVRKGPIDELAGPARRLAAADPRVWPQVKQTMLAKRKAPKGDYRSLLRAIGGDVPNKYGHFSLRWKKAHGHPIKLSEDWLEDLLVLPRSKISPVLMAVYRDCILQSALLRASATIGQHPRLSKDVVAALLDAAYVHQGTFRDEVGRAIGGVGNNAVPHLITFAIPPSTRKRDREKPEVVRAAYAKHNLDRMNRLHPKAATDAVREDSPLLASVLAAYGRAKRGDAADVLLDYVDNRSQLVRSVSRVAFESYVVGPPPKLVSRKIRLLGGGTGRAQAFLTYRELAAKAIRARLGAQARVLLEAPCEVQREDGSTDRVCLGQPERLTRSYFAWLDLRRNVGEAAQVDAALAADHPQLTAELLDRQLAVNPALGHRDRIVPFYRSFADDRVAAGEPARAAQLYRKVAMLVSEEDAAAARSAHVQALLAEASVDGLDARGREMLLESARELAPEDDRVKGALAAVRTERIDDSFDIARGRWLLGTGLLALALIVLALLGGPLRALILRPRESAAC